MGYDIQGAQWRRRGAETGAALHARGDQHAERLKLRDLGNGIVLLVQDDFPCWECHDYFIQSRRNIIVKVEKNDGRYSRDHGLSDGIGLPVIIYYSGGAAAYIHKTPPRDEVPEVFAGIPDFALISHY